ncbi:hypothetical protein GQ457_06G010210 [Hibiscus cannabinus]
MGGFCSEHRGKSGSSFDDMNGLPWRSEIEVKPVRVSHQLRAAFPDERRLRFTSEGRGRNSRTHDQVELQSFTIKSSSCETNSFVSRIPEITQKREIPGENHNFDFFLKQLIWIFNLNSKVWKLLPEELEKSHNPIPGTRGNRRKSKEGMRLGF